MKTRLIPTLVLVTLAPLVARAEEPPPAQADETTATTAEDLPYGAGYEARERLAQGEQKAAPDPARARQAEAAQAQERDRGETRSAAEARAARGDTQRSSTQRESRREAREQRGQRGPTRH